MQHEKIATDQNIWMDQIPEICAEVAIGCAETAEILKGAENTADEMRAQSNNLATTIKSLEQDTSQVAMATRQARLLSDQARKMLQSGEQTITMSTHAFADIIGLIDELGHHVTGFAGAMDQVRNASQSIDGIARVTNMLALNASIEAAKAGDAGRSFAVVADEVKKLASNSRTAAVEITQTINSLADEAAKFVARIEAGKDDSDKASQSFEGLQKLLSDVSSSVAEIGDVNSSIADSSAALHDSLVSAARIHQNFDHSVEKAHSALDSAMHDVRGLENKTNRMFDNLVHSGMARNDRKFVSIALDYAADLIALTEQAIDLGEISSDEIFDSELTLIPGSNPQRYTTKLTPWADQNWRPFLDKVVAGDEFVISSVCTDMRGFLPTHMSSFSRVPTGNLAHDTAYCRNGRVVLEGIDIAAKKSEADYMTGVYCQEGDGTNKQTVRNIYVPLRFKGRRWGDLEIAYVI